MQLSYVCCHALTQSLLSLPNRSNICVISHRSLPLVLPSFTPPQPCRGRCRLLRLLTVLTNATMTSIFSPFFTLSLQILSDVFGLFQTLLLEHKCDSVIPILKHLTFNYTSVFHFNSSLIYFLLTISIPHLAFLWICSKQDKWLHLTLEPQKHHSVPTALSNTSIRRDHADTPEMSSFLSPSPLAFFGNSLTLSWVDFPHRFWHGSINTMTLAFFFSSHSTFSAASS